MTNSPYIIDRLIIGSDIDEPLFPFLENFCIFHNDEYGTKLKTEEFTGYDMGKIIGVSNDEIVRRVLEFYQTDLFRLMEPTEGAVESIQELKNAGHLLMAPTARPDSIANITHEQVNDHFRYKGNPAFFKIEYGNTFGSTNHRRKKSEICEEYGVKRLIEDGLHYARDCITVVDKVYLFDVPGNQCNDKEEAELKETQIIRCKGWNRILEEIFG
jgi:hypothetical protein